MPNQNSSRRKRQGKKKKKTPKGSKGKQQKKHKKKTKRKRDSSSSSAEDKPSDKRKKKGERTDDEKTAFPGTTYKYLGGKELPGTTADRAKIAYPRKFKLNILREMAPELITAIKSIKVSETQTDKLFLIATDLGPHCHLKTIPLHSKSRLGFKEVMLKDCGGMGKQRLSEVRADFSNLDEVAQKYKWDQECIPAEFQDKGSYWTERTNTGEYVLCDKHGRRATVAGTVAPQPQLIYNATEGGQHQIIQGIHKHNCE